MKNDRKILSLLILLSVAMGAVLYSVAWNTWEIRKLRIDIKKLLGVEEIE